ncbi:MAG: HEPN domain-containing protein [Planctomycetota bacterium]
MLRPEQLHLITQWIEKAEEDYKNAEYTLTLEEDCPVSTVCFHSQQCIEKYLKAPLICHSAPVPKSHDLMELYHRLAPEYRPALSEEGLAILNRYAVESRYPGGWEVILRQAISRNLSRMMKRDEGA